MARLTRQEIKRDEVLETASRVFRYLTEHTRGMVIGALSIVAIAVVIAAALAFLQGRVLRANALFAEALSAYEAEIAPGAAEPEKPGEPTFESEEARDLRAQELFESLESRYGGTAVGRIANVYLGKLALRRGDAAAARQYWKQFVAEADDEMLGAQVRLNLLALDRSEGNAETVVAELREMVAAGDSVIPTDVALDQLAMTLEDLGQAAEARDIYQRLVDEFPASPYSSRARQKLSLF